jgi:hypothetical protein
MLQREDLSVEARRILESREKLEKKALLYEKLARGETVNGVTREQLREGLLVDFETKAVEESYKDRSGKFDDTDSDEEEDDESKTVPKKGKEDEDDDEVGPSLYPVSIITNRTFLQLVETTDDLGRTRWVRRSQLAAEPTERVSVMDGGTPLFSNDIKLASSSWHPADNQHTYYGDQREFHVYEPSAEELEARRARLNLDIPLNKHFDSTAEIRNRGAGFMQLSADEEERKKQMEALKNEREETERKRAELQIKGDAAMKREKELDERRRLIEEKKLKILERRRAAQQLQQPGGSESRSDA